MCVCFDQSFSSQLRPGIIVKKKKINKGSSSEAPRVRSSLAVGEWFFSNRRTKCLLCLCMYACNSATVIAIFGLPPFWGMTRSQYDTQQGN